MDWKKVHKCKHINLSPNYCEFVQCLTPYCDGYETHCLDCGVYITQCKCHSSDGLSGWSHNRWLNFERKKQNANRTGTETLQPDE